MLFKKKYQIKALEKQIEELVEMNSSLKENLKSYNEKNNNLINELENKEELIHKLELDISNLEDRIKNKIDLISTYEKQINFNDELFKRLTDIDYVNQLINEWLKNVTDKYSVMDKNIVEYGPQYSLAPKMYDFTNDEVIQERSTFLDKIVEQVEFFKNNSQKKIFLYLLADISFDDIYEALKMLVELYKKFKSNKDFVEIINYIIKKNLKHFKVVSNSELIKKKGKCYMIYDGWDLEMAFKSVFWEIIQTSNDLDTQILSLYYLIDMCLDYQTNQMSMYYEDSVTLYDIHRDYFVGELVYFDYCNKEKILFESIKRLCIMEKYNRCNKGDEILFLLLEYINIKEISLYDISELLNSILDIGNINLCIKTLRKIIEQVEINQVLLQCIDIFCKKIVDYIKTEPPITNKIHWLAVRHYSIFDLNTLTYLKIFVKDEKIKSLLINVYEYLEKLVMKKITLLIDQILNDSFQVCFDEYIPLIDSNYSNYSSIKDMSGWEVEVVWQSDESLKRYERLYDYISKKGDIDAYRHIAYKLLSDEKYEEALKIFKTLSDKGDPRSINMCGIILSKYNLTNDYEEIINYYLKAAQKGVSVSFFNIGELYYTGTGGIEKNYTKAIEYFLKSAQMGNYHAMRYLGDTYKTYKIEIDGENSNYQEAKKWYFEGLKYGDYTSIKALSEFYKYGYGVDKNQTVSQKLFELSQKMNSHTY